VQEVVGSNPASLTKFLTELQPAKLYQGGIWSPKWAPSLHLRQYIPSIDFSKNSRFTIPQGPPRTVNPTFWAYSGTMNASVKQQVRTWSISRLVEYARNPRKNDSALDRPCGSIREFGITEVPVMLCDEWTSAQGKAFR
jgi:hypothetical protein